MAQTPKAHADVVNQNNAVKQTDESSASPQSSTSSSSSVVLSAKTPASAGAVTAKSNSDSSAAVANSAATSTADSSSQPSSQASSASSQKQDVNQVSKVASIQARAASNLTSGVNAKDTEANQIMSNAEKIITSKDGRYTLYITRTHWGNTTNGDTDIKVLLSGHVQAGDTVKISIPNFGIVNATAPTIDSNYGSSSMVTDGNNSVITFHFTNSGLIDPIITIPWDNGYGVKDSPMKITTPTKELITWQVNGNIEDSADFYIDIDPIWDPTFKRTNPNPDTTDKTALKNILPGYRTVYNFTVNETNGVTSPNSPLGLKASKEVNSAVNYGTVITIPMPKGFVLDVDATKAANNFKDQTTITQDGQNIIINVPKGSGKQNWNSGSGYQIIGTYNIAMPDTETTITAEAPITIVQQLGDAGSNIPAKTWNGPTVSEKVYGKDQAIPLGSLPLYKGNAYNNGYLLNNGKKQIVAYFGATNQAI